MPIEFSPTEVSRLDAMFAVFLNCQSEISLPQAMALIAVARHPGLSVNELAERLEQPQQTVSRNVSVLLGRYQTSETVVPRAFIRQEINVNDPRSRALFLAAEGETLLKALVADRTSKGVRS